MAKLPVMTALIFMLCMGCSSGTMSTAITPTEMPKQVSSLPTQSPAQTEASPTSSIEAIATTQPSATAVQVGATTNASTPTPSLPQGWQTFIWAELHIAIDYPPDWSVKILATGLAFSSPQKAVINLTRAAASGIPPEDYLAENDLPNTRCTTIKNRYGVAARTCFDTIARTTSANLVITPPQGEVIILVLATEGRSAPQIVDGIIQSIRIAP
jgi:hypothetical protein